MKGFIVYPDYTIIDNKTHIRLFGKLENGQSFLAIIPFKPYFYIRENDEKKIEKYLDKYTVEKTKLKNKEGESMIKISSDLHIDLNKLNDVIKKSVDTYESDIKPHMRFMIDKDLKGSLEIDGEYESSERIDRVYHTPKISPAEKRYIPKLKIVSIDTESSESGRLYCIGLYSDKLKRVFMVTNHTDLKNVIPCKDDEECLQKFKSELIKLDPDILTGWNLIDFDLAYLQELSKKHKTLLDLGRTDANLKLRLEENFFRSSSAGIEGRQVLDALNLVRDPFIQGASTLRNAEFETYQLEDVSQALLGRTKLITGKDRHIEIQKLYNSKSAKDHQKLADYNLMDCQLVYEILEKTKLIELAIQRSMLTGMPLDRITASIAAFDSLYIREANKRGLASPAIHFGNKEQRLKGGYVFSSKPGIYNNVLIFDFKSFHPSIIKTFNLDPFAFQGKHKLAKDDIEAPNKVYFRNDSAILPEIIGKLHEAREKAKHEHNEFASMAIKIIMNSFWGVLASGNCRYFDFDMASAIISFVRQLIQLTAKKIEEGGYKVIYMDTDSCFVDTDLGKAKANALGKELQDYVNDFYKEYVKTNYRRDSFLELQFQKQYLSMMIPQVRMKAKKEDAEEKQEVAAAKKRYAGLLEKNGKEELEIIGLEAIRGDWVEAAQEFQKELLNKVFHKEEITKFIKSYIKQIQSGKLDKQLVYRKSIRKNLSEYTKTTPPHVKAARKLPKLEGNIIEYYITTQGPEPIQRLKHKIDYEHYIDKQIKPIANQVLVLFNKDFDTILKDSKQAKLF